MRIHEIRICTVLVLISALFYSCKRAIIPTLPINYDSYFTECLENQNFIFHYDSGDYVQPQRQEAFHEWATTQLGVICPKKIDYYKYRDRNHIHEINSGHDIYFPFFDGLFYRLNIRPVFSKKNWMI